MNDNEKILLVDDELRVVQALQRALRSEFTIEIAGGPEIGLQVLARDGPFAVVVSDLRMPGMDGIQFLARVKAASPESIRVMLTGQAELNAAIAAVNEGNIFRFLTKPCPPATLGRVLEAALEQHRLITAERELLQNTLMGCVTVLTEILSVVYPAAFSRSFRIKHYAALVAKALECKTCGSLRRRRSCPKSDALRCPWARPTKSTPGRNCRKKKPACVPATRWPGQRFCRESRASKARRRLSPGSRGPTASMRRRRRT